MAGDVKPICAGGLAGEMSWLRKKVLSKDRPEKTVFGKRFEQCRKRIIVRKIEDASKIRSRPTP